MREPRILLPTLLGLLLASGASAHPDEARPLPEVVADLDAALAEAWKEAGVSPAKNSKSAEFFRRASLDLTGVVPEEDMAASIGGRRSKAKRPRLVQGLLRSKNYANFMATRWANLLVGRSYLQRQNMQMRPLIRWLQQQFAANTSWDVVTRELISAEGRVDRNGAAEYIARYDRKSEEMAGNMMRVFQGQQVQCAQCHDHPYKDTWKQESFWGVAAFFGRVQQQRDDNMIITISERTQGEVRMPGMPGQRRQTVEPKFITGESIDPDEGAFRRTELARIVTSDNNPWFVRATVNRVWTFFFGAGFTDPDDLAKPELPGVLAVLEADFRASGYDMRRLCELIVSSRAYQLTSTGPIKSKVEQVEVFARAPLRTLTAEQLWWSFERATGLEATLTDMNMNGEKNAARQQHMNLRRRFFTTFGTEEQGAQEAQSLTQALMLLNGPFTNDYLWANRNPLVKRLLEASDEGRVNSLFLRVLGRNATKGERRALRSGGQSSQEKSFHVQDIFWALLNSSEFTYNH